LIVYIIFMANKKDTSFSLKGIVAREASISDEGIANWALTVIENGFFRSLPSWIYDINIPPGTEKSAFSDVSCLSKLNAYYRANPKILHPQKAIETKLSEGPVQFTPKKIIDMEGHPSKITRGFILPEELKDELSVVAPAMVATSLAYHVDYDNRGKQIPLADKREYERLGWQFPDLGDFRNSLRNTTRSKTVSQAEMYAQVVKDSAGAIHMMCGILSKTPQFCIPASEGITKFMTKKYDKDSVPISSRYEIVVPKGITLKTMRLDKGMVDKLWNYLNDVRMKRGEDGSGRGPLSMGYYFCDMPRSIIKDISMIYDLRALMKAYNVTAIQLPTTFPEYVKRALVYNGYSVISPEEVNRPAYVKKVPGIYRKAPSYLSMIIIKNMLCDRPDVVKRSVSYPTIDLQDIKNDLQNAVIISGSKKNGGNRYVLSKLPLMPKLADDLALYPSTSPHNGYVWVGSSYGTGSYDFDKLVLRSLSSNIYRNQYVLNRVNYWTIDPAVDFFHFDETLKLPKLSIGKTKVETAPAYEFLDGEERLIEQETLKVDVSSMIDKSIDRDCYKAGSLMTIVSFYTKSMTDQVQLKGYILAQYKRYVDGNDVHTSLRDVFKNYENGMETVYQAFGFADFDSEYKFYVDNLEEIRQQKDKKGKSSPITVSQSTQKVEDKEELPEEEEDKYPDDYGLLDDDPEVVTDDTKK